MADQVDLVARLQAGDEDAFISLVDSYHVPMLRVASSFVPSRAIAEEVVQDTWLGVVRGIERFEGRSSLKTWLYSILVKRARAAGGRERRLARRDNPGGPTVEPDRFGRDGTWSQPPEPWSEAVDERIYAEEMAPHLRAAVDELPEAQRQVVLLRDVEGMDSNEVCAMLGVSQGNQRVLLHRGRARIRASIERELGKR
jgi:RNA polymerase sigma-70 factor (ECF subfamily)